MMGLEDDHLSFWNGPFFGENFVHFRGGCFMVLCYSLSQWLNDLNFRLDHILAHLIGDRLIPKQPLWVDRGTLHLGPTKSFSRLPGNFQRSCAVLPWFSRKVWSSFFNGWKSRGPARLGGDSSKARWCKISNRRYIDSNCCFFSFAVVCFLGW